MIIELDINGARVIISGENLAVSVTEGDAHRRIRLVHALTQYRVDNELTLEAFGDLVGTNKSVVYRWEQGTIPRRQFIKQIQDVTGGKVTASDWYPVEAN